MKTSRCDTCAGILDMLEQAVKAGLHFSGQERLVLLARAEASIKESERVMLLRMPRSDKIQ